jgi:hypothetical protein
MLIDVLSHPLSILQALLGAAAGRIEDVRFSTLDFETEVLETRFTLVRDGQAVEVAVELVGRSAAPREAWLAIDGQRARRSIRASDYALALEDGGRTLPLPDPLAVLVRDFVAALSALRPGARPPRADAIAWRMQALCEIVRVFEAGAGTAGGA